MSATIYLIRNKDKFREMRFKNTFIAQLHGQAAQTSAAFYDELKIIFELPDYFGSNLDALYDCLMDAEWITKDHIILVIDEFQDLLSKEENDPELLEDFLLLMDDVSKSWELVDASEFDEKSMQLFIHYDEKAKELLELNDLEYEII